MIAIHAILILGSLLLPTTLLASPSIVNRAINALENKDFTQAQMLIDQAIEAHTVNEQASTWYYRGVIYEALLRDNVAKEEAAEFLALALASYQQALALAPATSQYHSFAQININGLWAYYLDRGRRYYKQEAFERAIDQFDICKKIKPEDPYAYLYTGIAAHQDERYELALHNYEQYLKVGGDSPAVHRGLANITADCLKDTDKALATLDQALLRYPLDNDLLQAQMQLYMRHDGAEEKERLLKEQIAAAPLEATFPYHLGYLYERWGQLQKALEYYQKAASLATDKVEPVLQQGIVYYNQAVQVLDKIADMSEEEFQQVGTTFIKTFQEHLKQALPYFEKANAIKARDVFILKHLCEAYLRLNMLTKANKTERCLRKIEAQRLRTKIFSDLEQ